MHAIDTTRADDSLVLPELDPGWGSVLRTASVAGLSTCVAQAAGYLMVFALTLSLGVKAFGLFTLAMTVMGISTLIGTLGMDIAAVRFAASYRGRGDVQGLRALLLFAIVLVGIWSSVVAAGLWGMAPFLSQAAFKEPVLTSSLRIVSLGVPLQALFLVFVSGLHGMGLTTHRVRAEQVILPLARLVLVVAAVNAAASVDAALWAMVAASGLSVVVAGTWLVRKSALWKASLAPRADRTPWVRYAAPAFLDALLVTPLGGSLEILLLGMFGTKEMVGIYSVVLRVKFITALPAAMFNTALAPVISEVHARLDRERLKGLFGSATRWVMMLSLPLAAINVLFGRELLGLFGQGYSAGYSTLVLVTLGQLVNIGVGPVGHLLLMTGYSRIRLLNSLILLGVQLGLGLSLIPLWKLEGTGLVAAASVAVVSLLGLVEVVSLLKIHPYEGGLAKPLLACGLASTVVAAAQPWLGGTLVSQAFLLCGFVLTYLAALVGLGLNADDRRLLLQARNRLVPNRP